MSGALVLYGSRYGYTRTYAQWIAEDLEGTALDLASATPEDVAEADAVVLGFSDYAGKLTDAAEAERLAPHLDGRALGFFTVSFSGTVSATAEKLDGQLAKNLPTAYAPHRGTVPTGHFRGGIDYSRLSRTHRTAMMGVRTFLKAKPDKSVSDQQMIDSYGGSADYSDRASTADFVAAVRAQRG